MCWNSVLRGGYRRWSQISSKSPSPEEKKAGLPEFRPAFVAEEGVEQSDQQWTSLPEQAQTGHELSAPCKRTTVPSGRVDATNGHAMASRQPEPLVQPSGLPVQGPTTRSGRVVKKPAYLRDYVTGM